MKQEVYWKTMPGTYSPTDRVIILEKCLEESKDCLAHRKFVKKSGLVCRGEVPRTRFPRGLEGWLQWRTQFLSRSGDDMRPVENTLKSLLEQRKLSQDDYVRLRRLYGLDLRAQQPTTGIQCRSCGATAGRYTKYCTSCGSEMMHPKEPETLNARTYRPEQITASLTPKTAPVIARKPVERICSSCGVENEPSSAFCINCGHEVSKPIQPAISPTAPGTRTCGQCGATVNASKRFCSSCGAPVTQTVHQPTGPTCSKCGSRVPAGKRFCTSCGTRLVAS